MNKGKEMIKEIKKLGVESIIMDLKPISKTVDIDKSKLGGNYFFAVNGIHPKTKEGKEMIFLCQLNLSELTKNHILPNAGLLQFFISEDFKECKVFYYERYNENGIRIPNKNCNSISNSEYLFVNSCSKISYPTPLTNEYEKIRVSYFGNHSEPFSVFRKFFERNNQIGGYAYYCQIDDRRKDEVLLLQIPSNSNLGINFYDNGICHFFIKKEDLEQLNFDNVRLVIDSE